MTEVFTSYLNPLMPSSNQDMNACHKLNQGGKIHQTKSTDGGGKEDKLAIINKVKQCSTSKFKCKLCIWHLTRLKSISDPWYPIYEIRYILCSNWSLQSRSQEKVFTGFYSLLRISEKSNVTMQNTDVSKCVVLANKCLSTITLKIHIQMHYIQMQPPPQ